MGQFLPKYYKRFKTTTSFKIMVHEGMEEFLLLQTLFISGIEIAQRRVQTQAALADVNE